MERLEEEANEWIKNSSKKYSYDRTDTDNMMKFSVKTETSTSLNFNITSEMENGKFSIWSENTDFLPFLDCVIDYCESERTKTLDMILCKVDHAVDRYLKESGKGSSKDNEDDDDDVEDDDDMDDCYYDNDEDAMCDTEVIKKDSDDEELEETFFGGQASPAAFQRLAKDLKNMKKEAHKFGILGNPRGDNIFLWDVKLTGFSKDTKLGKDLEQFAEKYKREPVVYIEMQFPGEYPMAPPFVRVIRPRFKFLTGHVTIGGSICMEMLTRSGWRPTNDIESILVQIRSEIMSDPNARLDPNPDREYGEAEAKDAFNRMVSRYGWNK